jgi:hypothetical protein
MCRGAQCRQQLDNLQVRLTVQLLQRRQCNSAANILQCLTNEVCVEHAAQQLLALGEGAEDLTAGEGGVQEQPTPAEAAATAAADVLHSCYIRVTFVSQLCLTQPWCSNGTHT